MKLAGDRLIPPAHRVQKLAPDSVVSRQIKSFGVTDPANRVIRCNRTSSTVNMDQHDPCRSATPYNNNPEYCTLVNWLPTRVCKISQKTGSIRVWGLKLLNHLNGPHNVAAL
jgi:hypothetical protein